MENRDLDRVRFVTRHFNDLQGLRYWVPVGLVTLSIGGTTWFDNRPLVLFRAALFLGGVLLMLGARWYYRHAFGEVERRLAPSAPELAPVSIFSPAGPAPRVEGFPQVPPIVQRFSFVMGLALVLFFILQAFSPTIMVVESQSLAEPPWLTMDAVFIHGPHWSVTPLGSSTVKAVLAQTLYALFGSFFLGLWLWRERRPSQSLLLVLGLLLLGLAALGSCLGFFVYSEEGITRVLDLFVPAVIHLWIALLLCGASMILVGLLDHWQLVRALIRSGDEGSPVP